MRIHDLAQTTQSGATRIEASVVWEDSDRPALRLFFETIGGADYFWPDPNAFLVACILPAWQAGERRLLVEGALCPVLERGIRVPLAMLKSWYPEMGLDLPTIESTLGSEARTPSSGQSLSLLSCGVDSTATLRWNRLNIPADHPEAIRAVVVMSPSSSPSLCAEDVEQRSGGRLEAVRRIAEAANVEAIPLVTNILKLSDLHFFSWKWHGAVFCSLASLFSNRFRKAFIAGTCEAPESYAWGSHPLIDPYYGSAHFTFAHDGFDVSRLNKLRLVAAWQEGLSNLRVCQNDGGGSRNCGTCEKCIRTMLALVTIGKLQECIAFPRDEVDEQLVWTLDKYDMVNKWGHPPWYQELSILLKNCGRNDLATAVDGVLEAAIARTERTATTGQ